MSRVIFAWGFGAIFFQLTSGAVYVSLARQLGMKEAMIGFMGGVFPLFSFLQIIAARSLERNSQPRRMMLGAGLVCRSMWVVAAALPLINHWLPGMLPATWLLPFFVVCVVISAVMQAFTGPSFFAWMSYLVPDRVGPSFWARRQQVGVIVGVVAVVAGGWVADQAGRINTVSGGHFPPILTYSAILTLASLCGVVDIATFFGVKEPPGQPHNDQPPPLATSLLSPLKETEVRGYILYISLATLSGAMGASLVWLYCLENLGYTKTQTGFALTVMAFLGMAASYRFWGAASQTYGSRPLLRFVSIAGLPLGLIWFVIGPHSLVPLSLAVCLSGVLGAAVDICNLNFMTRACPHVPRPMLIALFSLCTGTVAAVGSTLGGKVAEELHGWHWNVLGLHLVNYHVVFAASMVVGIFNAFCVVPHLQEPGSTSTRSAVKGAIRETRRQMRERAESTRLRGASLYHALGSRIMSLFQARGE